MIMTIRKSNKAPRSRAIRLLGWLVVTVLLGTAAVAAQSGDYALGPGDVVSISVWNQPDLTGKFSVEPDGTFTFPLIGRVKAGGLGLRELEAQVVERLANGFLKNPQVSVTIDAYSSQRIFVVGEVRTPGAYPLRSTMTLLEALVQAGSTTSDAGNEAVIVRAAPGGLSSGPILPGDKQTPEVVQVQLGELEGGWVSQNVQLRDGDTVFVPRAASVFVYGQVRNPGAFRIQRGYTVLQALSLAGGVTDRGSTRRIKIIRVMEGSKKEITATLDDVVQPGDTLVVGERFF